MVGARAPTSKNARANRRGGDLFTLMMVAPLTLYVLAVSVYPLLYSLGISLFRYRLTDPSQTRTFTGIANYVRALGDPQAVTAVVNTLVFVIGAVGLEFVIGLGLALLLWRDTRFNQTVAALMLIPIALTPLVVGLVWRAILNPDFGQLGWYLSHVFGVREGLTGNGATAMLAIIFVDAWQWTPLMMLVLLAGLKSLPVDPYEAARVDGAGTLASFRYLTLPLLAPTVVLALLVRTMDAFKLFDIIFAMTQGGPGQITTVLTFYTFKQGLVFFDMGYAASLSNVLLVVIALFSVVYIAIVRAQERRRFAPVVQVRDRA